jgi:transposase, IS6 family
MEELMRKSCVAVDHSTVFRWIQRYAMEMGKRCRPPLNAINNSYLADETAIKVKRQRYYLYRGVESEGNTIDFMPSAIRNAKAPQRFFRKILRVSHTALPRVITVDKYAAYLSAFEVLQQEGTLPPTCTLRPCPHLIMVNINLSGRARRQGTCVVQTGLA